MSTNEEIAAFGIREARADGVDSTWAAQPATLTLGLPVAQSALTIALHWASAVVIVLCAAVVLAREVIEHDGARLALISVHRQLGLLVLLGAGIRAVRRLRQPLTDHARDMSAPMRIAAKATHVLFYAILAALPIVGWAQTNAHGIPVSFLGVMGLPNLVAEDSDVADSLGDVHVYLAWGLLLLVVLHAAAALWHHFVRRDFVLRAMLPSLEHARGRLRRVDAL